MKKYEIIHKEILKLLQKYKDIDKSIRYTSFHTVVEKDLYYLEGLKRKNMTIIHDLESLNNVIQDGSLFKYREEE